MNESHQQIIKELHFPTTTSTSNYSMHSPQVKSHQQKVVPVLCAFPFKDLTNTINNRLNQINIVNNNVGLMSSYKDKGIGFLRTYDKFQQSGKKSVKIVNELINDLDIKFDAIENYQELLMKRAPTT